MPHIQVSPSLPGIISLFDFRKETAKPLCDLAQTLLQGPSTLSKFDRELIAAVVSYGNNCLFCSQSHAAVAKAHDEKRSQLVEHAMENFVSADLPAKTKSLLKIALQVRESGKAVQAADVENARKEGATDIEIHDTILIAAAFCMYNRYVDGLATLAPPKGSPAYLEMGRRLAAEGYHA